MSGAGAYNKLIRINQHEDVYAETYGDIYFEGLGGYNNIYSDIAHGNIIFKGTAGFNKIIRTTQGTGDQAAFERIGSTTFANYFDDNQAKIVIAMADKDTAGEREYLALSNNALNIQIQAMSAFTPQAGVNGFFDSLDNEAKPIIAAAWTDRLGGKGILA